MPRFHTKETTVLGRLAEQTVKPDGEDGCWEWTGMTNKDGYGRLTVDKKTKQVHRLSFMLHKYEIPSTVQVRHTCDNPPCWNPEHLQTGTNAQNIEDKVKRGRQQRGNSHPLSKLTAEQVIGIRVEHAAGKQYKELAEKYGVQPCNIGLIVRRVSWKHI